MLFNESLAHRIERIGLGTVWALHPKRIGDLPALAKMHVSEWIAPSVTFPDPNRQLNDFGLCGIVREPSASAIIDGYKRGLFTFAHYGPLKWMSLPQRSVLFYPDFHIAKNVRRFMKQGKYRVTFDRDFESVIKMCAAPRPGRWHVTWITPRIMRLYAELFDAGYAHSIEVWNSDGELAGGSFGLGIGGAFFGESQFSRESHTSKIAMAALTWHLDKWGFAFSDGKWETPTLRDMGFRCIPRPEFLTHLDSAVHQAGRVSRWQIEADLSAIAAWQPAPVVVS
ncbi:MAG: leucyl/phenylalanyl-tRNA--protein transferase [Xanthobacteraceae bacterium]